MTSLCALLREKFRERTTTKIDSNGHKVWETGGNDDDHQRANTSKAIDLKTFLSHRLENSVQEYDVLWGHKMISSISPDWKLGNYIPLRYKVPITCVFH